MTQSNEDIFQADLLKVRRGEGKGILASRQQMIDGFEIEQRKCLNPFRKELLADEIGRLKRELHLLRNQCKSTSIHADG